MRNDRIRSSRPHLMRNVASVRMWRPVVSAAEDRSLRIVAFVPTATGYLIDLAESVTTLTMVMTIVKSGSLLWSCGDAGAEPPCPGMTTKGDPLPSNRQVELCAAGLCELRSACQMSCRVSFWGGPMDFSVRPILLKNSIQRSGWATS